MVFGSMYREKHGRPIVQLQRTRGINGKKQLREWVESQIGHIAEPALTEKEVGAIEKGLQDIQIGRTKRVRDIHNLWDSVF